MNFDILRQKILEKAIRGELVPQLESEPAVEQIGDTPGEVPFAISEKWKWVQLNNVTTQITDGTHHSPVSFSKGDPRGKFLYVTAKNIKFTGVDCSTATYVTEDAHNEITSRCLPKFRDVLYIKDGATTGVVTVNNIEEPFSLLSSVALIRPIKLLLDPYFLSFTLRAKSMADLMRGKMKGTGIPRVTLKIIKKFSIPLPPLEEQHRIITKINQLFAQIDCAEKAYNELSGPLSERFRQLCLEKAIQGKLVPQLESEPEVEQVGDAPEDVPFEIPEKWRWMQLNKVGKIVGGGTPKTSVSEYWDGGTIPWFTPADLGKVHGLYASDSARKITALGLKESSAVMMPPNSVLFSSRAPIGHIALAADSCCTNQGCKSFVPNVGIVLPLWGYFAMKARTPDMIARASGTTFKEISGKGVGETLVPIPPLEEQRRIVTKLSEILNVVRQLENSVLIS